MARKLGVLGLALFMGVVAFTLGVASASSGITAPLAITVIEHPDHDKVIDVGKKGDSTGDIFTFHNDLYDETDTDVVGADSGQCTRMSPKEGTWECWWSITLADGIITAEGPYSDSASSWSYAVTGGTGMYENVRGSMLETMTPSGERFVLAYSLIP